MDRTRKRISRRAFVRSTTLAGARLLGGLAVACALVPTPAVSFAATHRPDPSLAASLSAELVARAAPADASRAMPTQQPAGTLTIAQGVDAESMDPYVTTSSASTGMMWTIFDRLVYRDLDLQIQPGLALSWRVITDTTWELTLRQGVQFHNGEPFDANAVKFSFARYVDPSIKNGYATLLKPVTEVEVVDAATVRIHTSEPFAELIEVLASYVEMLPPRAAADAAEFVKNPIGTGPYRFVSWAPNDRFVVEAAGPHWSGEPRMQQVIFRPIPEGTARINELRAGGTDVITNVSPLLLTAVQNQPGIEIARATAIGSIILIPSFLTTDVFIRKEVRQAMNYAIDKDDLIRVVLRGEAVPMSSPSPRGVSGGFVDSLRPYPYDPDRAKALLSEAGYPDGFSVSFKAPNGRYLQDKQVAEAIVGQLEKVGIRADLETIEWGTYVQGIVGRRYELFLLSQGGVQIGPAAQTNWSSRIKGIAWQGYENATVDALIDRAATTMDAAARRAAYEEMSKTVWDDAPWIFLYHQQDIYGVRDRVKGFKPTSEGSVRLAETEVTS